MRNYQQIVVYTPKTDISELYWKDHQLWMFIKFDISHDDRTKEDEIIGVVEHNGWKFSVSTDDCISYITPNGEKGYFINC